MPPISLVNVMAIAAPINEYRGVSNHDKQKPIMENIIVIFLYCFSAPLRTK